MEGKRTEVEQRLDKLIADYGAPDPRFTRLLNQCKSAVSQAEAVGLPYELIAYAVAQHAAGLVGAQKMTGVIRPEFAQALADDFSESVISRSIPGVPCFITPGVKGR